MPKASKYGVRKTGGVLGNNSVVSYYGTVRTATHDELMRTSPDYAELYSLQQGGQENA